MLVISSSAIPSVGYTKARLAVFSALFSSNRSSSSIPKKDRKICDPIQITKNEIITVEQIFHSKYSLENGMYDSYHVTNHTIGVSVIFDLPKEFEVEIYPTFPEKYLPLRRYNGSQIIFDPIKFMVPGQGFGFSIKKL